MLEILAIGLFLSACSGPETTRFAIQRAVLPHLDAEISALSPDARLLAIAASRDRVLLIDVRSDEIVAMLEVTSGAALAMAWSADGVHLATLDRQALVTIFDVASGLATRRWRCEPALGGAHYDLRELVQVPGSNHVLVGFGTLAEILDVTTGRSILRIEPSEIAVLSSVAVSRDGALVAIGDAESRVGVWSVSSGQQLHGPIAVSKQRSWRGVQALDFDPSGRKLAIGSGDCTARIWDFGSPAPPLQLSCCDFDWFDGLGVGQLHFSPDGSRLVTTTFESFVTCMWDATSGARLWSHDFGGGNPSRLDSRFTPDGRFVFTECGALVLDAEDGRVVHTLGHTGESTWPRHRTSGEVAWAVRDDTLRVFEVESGATLLERATEP